MSRSRRSRSRRGTSVQAPATASPDSGAAPGPARGPSPAWDRRAWLVAIPLAVVVFAAFLPALDNGFVDWDDELNFLRNPHYRGLGPAQIRWAWTTFWVGVYQPLAWLLFEAQYVVWKLDPRGYHLVSLLLHAADAVVLYVLTVTLLRLEPGPANRCLESPWACSLAAGLATALFAVHPLRVEAVAWASCQPYLPCALFSMLTVLAYLKAFEAGSGRRRVWLASSFVLFAAALLSKAPAVSLPAVLLILDVYPLRRLGGGPGRWFGPSVRAVWWEKVPFVLLGLAFMGLAIAAKGEAQTLIPLEHDGPGARLAQACYGAWFYIIKTLLPAGITAFYPSPARIDWWAPPFLASIIGLVALSIGLFLLRRGRPGLLVAWLSYLVLLAPNSGLIRIGTQIAADRYSYMAMLGGVVVVAAGFCRLREPLLRARPVAIGVVALGLGAIVGLAALSWYQCGIWRTSESLWTHALEHGAGSSSTVQYGVAADLLRRGRFAEALTHYDEAIRLAPGYAEAYNDRAMILASCPDANRRDGAKAVESAAQACALTGWNQPAYLDTLAAAYAEAGDFAAAVKWQSRAIELLPDEAMKADFQSRLALYQAGKPYRQGLAGG
jgi:tetratricopeptide (TPR) repeat protein